MGWSQLSCVESDDLLALAPFLWQFYKHFINHLDLLLSILLLTKVDPTVPNRGGSIFYSYIPTYSNIKKTRVDSDSQFKE
jgi:hypothetical protein